MSLLAAHINDASLSLISADGVLYREPGFALLENGDMVTGEIARQHSRLKPRSIHLEFWANLSTTPLVDRRFAHLSAADLVSRQLESMWQKAASGDELVVAVPASIRREQISLFLGIAHDLGIPVAGLCDAAVAATRREYTAAIPIHVDVGLHSAMLTRILQASGAQFERAEVVDDAGVQSLAAGWVRRISDCFVNQSRFDPLHTAETEQLLFDTLPSWLATASGADKVLMQLEHGGVQHAAEIDTIDLIAAAGPVYQRIVGQVRALLRAGETPAIQLTDRAARLPGLADMLTARVGGEVFMLEPGATARGLLQRFKVSGQREDAVNLIQKLHWDQASVALRETAASAPSGVPSHLLFDSVAYPVSSEAIVLGSQKADGARWIDLQRELPGVSRHHCEISVVEGQCVVNDRSRYGTFLNGHRIDDSAVLQCGDVLRIGTPGVEFQLIRTVS